MEQGHPAIPRQPSGRGPAEVTLSDPGAALGGLGRRPRSPGTGGSSDEPRRVRGSGAGVLGFFPRQNRLSLALTGCT